MDPLKLSWEVSCSNHEGHLIVMARLAAPRKAEQQTRAPLNVSLILDRSGSMQGAKIDHCKSAARYAVSQLSPRDCCSIVAFSDWIDTISPHQHVVHKDRLLRTIDLIQAKGCTNLSGGWLHGAVQVERSKQEGQICRLILFTDGLPTDGLTHRDSLTEVARDLAARGIQTTAIGCGEDVDEDLLRVIAESGQGNFHFIESPEEASTVFAREFQELLTIVAQNVRLKILPSAGVQVGPFLQHLSASPMSGGYEVNLGDIFAGDERTVLIDFIPPPGQKKAGVGVLHLEYQQITPTIAFRELSAFVEADSPDDTPINPIVWREVILSQVSSDLKQAREIADSGDLQKACDHLRETRDKLEKSEFRGDPGFQEQSHEIERMEQFLKDEHTYRKVGRKSISAYQSSSARQKPQVKGGFLHPRVRRGLHLADSVVFLSARDLGLAAGLPDALTLPFEGLDYGQLSGRAQSPEALARQWRWMAWRQEAARHLDSKVHRYIDAFQSRWHETAVITTATDGLHRDFSNLVELFGSIWRGRCHTCQTTHCEATACPCGAPLHPDMVWPGASLPQVASERAVDLVKKASAVIVVGEACTQPNLLELLNIPQDILRVALYPGPEPTWATAHIRESPEEGLRRLANDTYATLPEA